MHTVIEEEPARHALEDAVNNWSGASTAWDVLVWVIARDPEAGTALNESGSVRAFEYVGARSICQPTITVLYEFQAPYVIIKDAKFRHAEADHAGRC